MKLNAARAVPLATLLAALVLVAGAHARPAYRGVQVHSLWESVTAAQMDRDLDAAAKAGANVVRVDVSWAGLEESRGDFSGPYERRVDRFMSAAGQRGLKVIATLWDTPCWASSAPSTLKQGCTGAWWDRGVNRYAPADPGDYADAVRLVVGRYGSYLAALEVWNEPNVAADLKGSDPAGRYAALVRAAYPAAKAADARVPVLAGSLSYADVAFLRASLYAHGAEGSYDGLSIHPYADGRPASAMGAGISTFHRAAAAAGDHAPIWITEFGWPTCSLGRCNSLTEQARYVGQGFRVLDRLPYVRGATVYQLRDMSTGAADPESNFGMLREDYSPRPAYAALRAALTGAARVRPGCRRRCLGSGRSARPRRGRARRSARGRRARARSRRARSSP